MLNYDAGFKQKNATNDNYILLGIRIVHFNVYSCI